MNLLRLFVPENWSSDQNTGTPWYWVTDTGLKGSSLDHGLPTGFRTQVFLPTEEVLVLDIDLPRKGRWREALPFAVEAYLMGDLSSSHIVTDTHSANPRTRAHVLDRNGLSQLLAYLKERGVQPNEVYAQAAMISNHANEWTILMRPYGGCLVQQNGYCLSLDQVDGGSPPQVLSDLLSPLSSSHKPTQIRMIGQGMDHEHMVKLSLAWSENLGIRCVVENDLMTQPMRALAPHATNLLTGEFAAESHASWRKLDGQMKLAVMMLAISAVIWVLGYAVQTWMWGQSIRELKAQAETELRRGFPETRSILDPELQMQKGLAELRAQAGYYAPEELPALLGRLKELGELEGAHLISLDYQNQNALLVWHCDSADQAQTVLGRLKQLGMEGTMKSDTTGQNVTLRLGRSAP